MAATFRVVVLGTGAVGKSSLVIRYVQGEFVDMYDPTIESNYRRTVDGTRTGEPCVLDILDTSGQDDFSALRELQMRKGDGFVLVYDVTTPQSFEAVPRFHAQALSFAEERRPAFLLLGNKCDLEDERAISAEEGRELARATGAAFFETSAKTDNNITQAFTALADLMLADAQKRPRRNAHHRNSKLCTLL